MIKHVWRGTLPTTCVQCSVSRPLLLSLVTSQILSRLDYGSATLVGIPAYLIDRLQPILHAAARLVNGSRKYDHVSSLLLDLHWLPIPERIMYRLAVLVFRCRNHTAPEYLTRDLHWVANDDSRRRLRSATTLQLMVLRTRLRPLGYHVFGIARSCVERSTIFSRLCAIAGVCSRII